MSLALLRLPDPLPLKRLPAALQKKIALEVPNANEENCCWNWTGFTHKARLRFRMRSEVNDPDYEGNREAAGSYGREKPMPMVRWPGRNGVVPAHRAVFARTYKLEIDDVPVLRRCANPECVSPHHVIPVVKNASRRPRTLVADDPAPQTPASPAKPPVAAVDEILGRLRAKSVSHYLSSDLAAAEIGLDPVLLTGDVWKQYYLECEAAENALDGEDEDD